MNNTCHDRYGTGCVAFSVSPFENPHRPCRCARPAHARPAHADEVRSTPQARTRKVMGEKERFTQKQTQHSTRARATSRRQAASDRAGRSFAGDFPLGNVGLVGAVLVFLAFLAAACYWIVVIFAPSD